MHYYIDGYNLLFRFHREENPLSKQRQQIIEDLNTKLQLLEFEVTIVFDAQYQLGESSRSHIQNLEILFSAFGETADECILDEIKAEKHPQQIIVVTSDKKLAWYARRCTAKTETVEHFMDWLNKRYKNKLLQQKQDIKPHKPLLLHEVKKDHSSSPKLTKPPRPKASPEECFDYYLEKFEKKFSEIEKKTEKKQVNVGLPKRKKKKIKEEQQTEEPIYKDELTRWQKIFEKNLKT